MNWFTKLSDSRKLLVFIVITTAVRLVAASLAGLGNDEAYYWAWSKHLDLSYFDHPPMVAYLIRCSTMFFGDSTVAIRLPTILLFAGFLYVMFKLSIRLYNSSRVGLLAALLCSLSPMTSVLGFLMLPDAPLLFFSAITLCLFWDFAEGKRDRWWLGGIMLGCALLSKYNGVLLCLSAAAFLALGSRNDRRLLLHPRLTGAVCLALFVFSPVLMWNMQHQWASFSFQLKHGFASSTSAWWMVVPGPLIAQAGYVSPVVWWGSMRTLGNSFKEMAKDTRARFIMAFGGIPIIFFILAGLKSPGLPHWTALGYAVLLVGLAARCSMNQRTEKIMLWGGALLGLLPLLLLIVHASVGLVRLPYLVHFGGREIRVRDQTDMLHGWNEWSGVVRTLTLPGGRAESVAAVVSHHWIVGGKAMYALRNSGIPVVVWSEGRKTQFDFWSTPDEYIGKDLLFVTTSQMDKAGTYWRAEAFYRADGFEQIPELSWPKENMQVTKFKMEIMRGFRGLRQFGPLADSSSVH